MRLIIAEKPKMAGKIAEALGGRKDGRHYRYADGYVTSCRGHLYELMDAEEYNPDYKEWRVEHLPIIPPTMKLRRTREKDDHWRISEIKKFLKDTTEVINAGDPGREGQAIVDEVLEMLGWSGRTSRIWLTDLQPSAVRKAYSELKDNKEYRPLFEAAKARAHADWIVGVNFSRLWTNKITEAGGRATFHVGRVQTPTLALVAARDAEIENFVSVTHYIPTIHVHHKNGSFKAKWIPPKPVPIALQPDQEGRLVDRQRASSLMLKQGATCVVTEYLTKPSFAMPPKPFALDDLQAEASSKYHITAARTLEIAQALYDTYEATTYPRTDNNYITESEWERAEEVVKSCMRVMCVSGDEEPVIDQAKLKAIKENISLQKKPDVFDDSKVGEHFAIIPTGNITKLAQMAADERIVFNLIVERYLLQFARPHRFSTVTVTLNHAGSNTNWGARGKTDIDRGWRALQAGLSGSSIASDGEEAEDDDPKQALPMMARADSTTVDRAELAEKKTTPPKPFTDATLIKLMANVHTVVDDPEIKKRLREREGLGEPATRTNIVESLIKRHYIKQFTGGKLQSTLKGRLLLRSVPDAIKSAGLTAVWEKGLDLIAQARVPYDRFMASQKDWLVTMLNTGKGMEITVTPEEIEFLTSIRPKKKFPPRQDRGQGGDAGAPAQSVEGATWLNVPFDEKDAAKALGARFSREKTSWYVPAGKDVAPFSKWVSAS